MRSILYISYDGLTDSLGQSQILAYLKRLSLQGNRIVILSYEKADRFAEFGSQVAETVRAHHLTWEPLTYTKRPPILSTVWDIRKGFTKCKELHRIHRFDIVHCRGYIAAIMGKNLKEKFGLKFIFDMRGWWPDEKLESGLWDKKIFRPVYTYFKKLERDFFRTSDYSVSLTYKGKEEIVKKGMAESDKIGVIPTCVDFELFQPWDAQVRSKMRASLGILDDERVFIYSGSVGGNYDPETLIRVFKAFEELHPKSFLLILSKDKLDEVIMKMFASAGIKRVAIFNVPFNKVTDYLRAGDVGFIYYKITFSTIGRSPTKLGEYWASGLPVISFKNIGDLDIILDTYPGSGVLLPEDPSKWVETLRQLKDTEKEELRSYARSYFHIDKGVQFYQEIYERLATSPSKQTMDRHRQSG
jgi:glycosyltransferase involved in cell wall biosynthesis